MILTGLTCVCQCLAYRASQGEEAYMGIFELIRIEHSFIRDILAEILEQTIGTEGLDPEEIKAVEARRKEPLRDWEALQHDLKLTLVAHNRAEESVLYDALAKIPHRAGLADVKTEEHRMAEELLEDLEEINPQDKAWDTKFALFKNLLESHFAEEESSVLPIIEADLTTEQNDQMIRDFESLRDNIVLGVKYHPKARSIIDPAELDLDS